MLVFIKCDSKTRDREANSIAIFKGYSKEISFIKEVVNKVIQQTYYWALDGGENMSYNKTLGRARDPCALTALG